MNKSIDRRSFATLIAGALFTGALIRHGDAMAESVQDTDHDMRDMPASWKGKERILLLAYPGMTALDLVGPQYMFASLVGAKVEVVAKSLEPIVSDTGLRVLPDVTFQDLPDELTLIFAPGGTAGTLAAMRDAETIDFLKAAGARAEFVTSVCTGSLLLGKAGLLKGYKATSHWLTLPVLPTFGATSVAERVVIDRNRITGAGVSAGLDFGLKLVGEFRNVDYAETVQLLCEYAPDPPFNAGTPDTAKPHQAQMLRDMLKTFIESASGEA